ncbi:hypothetical protein PBT90_13930 [Algoriphagus halophytocola]|uniref:Uncharacterized protein n=1 Tax=Algoriphagus halophytocola TaxID=2991499 RepID=A0ABY6ML39_9BACT|nr:MULTISPECIES: hypothetical protein [unclassified Algoriphagus]UZD24488.1 hypothetical protein OM944_08285 [Algoriphagus sp. TR-M5]WBL41852.1 hypothetical protein PBT90_13930 [Algoriphagus sp. TR-M9]
MVERILKFLTLTLIVLSTAFSAASAQQAGHQVRMIVSSSVFISGDAVSLQLLTLDEEAKLLQAGELINLYLVDHAGNTVAIERFNSGNNEAETAFLLPADLATANYKLVAQIPGSSYQTEALIHVYSPTIFSSNSLPENADAELGLVDEMEVTNSTLDLEVRPDSKELAFPVASDGVLAVKVFDPMLEATPILGEVKASEVKVENTGKFELITPSSDPNSRVSVYYIDQGIVEEYYLRDSAKIESQLIRHQGSSHVWAYQFDNMGERIGEVKVVLADWQNNQFASFENVVPFSDQVVTILDHKRKRKYIDQVYRTDFDNYEPIWQEEEQAGPDDVYLSKDYQSIATLREAFGGVVSKASVKRNKGEYELLLSPANAGFRYEGKPLILFNGSPIYGFGELMETPFHQVNSISVYNSIQSLKRFGVLGRYGVVEIEMKEEFEDPLLHLKEDYPYYLGVNDLVQVSEELAPNVPDLRPVLLWVSDSYVQSGQHVTFQWKPSDVEEKHRVWADFLQKDGGSIQLTQPLEGNPAQ